MNRFAAIIVLLTALCIGWVPVFAAPARLAAEIGSHNVVAVETLQASIHIHHASGCAGKQHDCHGDAKQQHPAVCAACIGVPAVALPALVIGQPKIVIPRSQELPLVAQAHAPLPRPPQI